MAKDEAGQSAVGGRLAGTRRAAFAALLVERLWPTLLNIGILAAIFLSLSWFGVFAAAPQALRLALVAVLAAGVLVVLWRARGIRLPAKDLVDRRIETESRLDHRPLQVQTDKPTDADPFSAELWREHQRRMAERLRNLSGGTAQTRTERLDPFGARALVALLLVTAFAFSYGPSGGRIADAVAAPGVSPIAGARIDAWVTPPAYTGRAPIFLTDASAATATPGDASADGQATGNAQTIEVPEGSVLSVRVSDDTDTSFSFQPAAGGEPQAIAPGGLPEMRADEEDGEESADATAAGPAAKPAASGEYEYALVADGSATLASTFRTLGNWSFKVTPDTAPTIAFIGEPAEGRNGALEIAYTVSDDYGVRQGRADIVVKDDTARGVRPLVKAPEIGLALPRRTKGEAKARTSTDLTENPYAGATVEMTLVATDDAGQVGRSAPKTFTLPARRFTNPLAEAVVEQRRILALDANDTRRVTEMLDAVTLRGEEYIPRAGDYLALRAVRTRIAEAMNDETLVSAVDFLWQTALGIEDGNLSLAEKRLRDAQDKLAEALDKGASDAEIDKLMAELREAMQEYMQAMAEAMKDRPPMSQEEMQNAQEIRPSDLEKMMDRIEDLAKSGSKDAAKQLLSELQQMMQSMQAMQKGQPQQGGEQNAMREQMDKLGEMLRKQQELKDKTFALGREQMQRQEGEDGAPSEQGEQQDGQPNGPMSDEELKQRLDALKEQQGQLQKDLEAMQEAMKGMGMQPGEGLGQAGEAMGKAEGALGQGDDGEAVGQQSQAMDALRRGAKDMMQQMQQAMGQGKGQGQGQQPGGQGQMGEGYGRGEQRSGRDPLGRPRSTEGMDFGQDVEVPDEIDTQRARRILDAIRNRLGDALSPQLEREYLERLLKTQ